MAATGRFANRRLREGHSVIEMALIAPWLLFLFAGALDMGFYSYAIISTQNAARVAAMHTSSSELAATDTAGACGYALAELNSMPNVRGVTSCDALPVIVTVNQVTGVDGAPASSVSVTYQSVPLIPIPGLMGQLTMTRTAQMRW